MMHTSQLHAVTGAFGYTGRYIAERLLSSGQRVITLTNNSKRPNPFGERVKAYPFNFHDPGSLRVALTGVDTLYNTYWVRFDHGQSSYAGAVANTRTLFQAAVEAGVRRIVHISVTNPDASSPLPYFRGKALLEEALQACGVSYAILRPTLIFGREDILVNNIAWLLRRFPLFAIPGDGSYGVQPVYVEDLAALALQAGVGDENQVIDAIGPQTFTFDELVALVAAVVGSRSKVIHVTPRLAYWLSRLVGWWVGDVLLTREEVAGLMAGLLVTDSPATGETRFSDWVRQNADALGVVYAHELKRHYRRA